MINIDTQGNISLTQGDYAEAPLTIKDGTSTNWVKYYLTENDYVEFILFQIWETPTNFIKKITATYDDMNSDGDVIFKLTPEFTADLSAEKYSYQIKIYRESEAGPETLFNKRWLQILA